MTKQPLSTELQTLLERSVLYISRDMNQPADGTSVDYYQYFLWSPDIAEGSKESTAIGKNNLEIAVTILKKDNALAAPSIRVTDTIVDQVIYYTALYNDFCLLDLVLAHTTTIVNLHNFHELQRIKDYLVLNKKVEIFNEIKMRLINHSSTTSAIVKEVAAVNSSTFPNIMNEWEQVKNASLNTVVVSPPIDFEVSTLTDAGAIALMGANFNMKDLI